MANLLRHYCLYFAKAIAPLIPFFRKRNAIVKRIYTTIKNPIKMADRMCLSGLFIGMLLPIQSVGFRIMSSLSDWSDLHGKIISRILFNMAR